ncbi:type I 3-dehydroquinate dehydratase [Bacillus sp. ISL-40]|uniref:type I 3-dehydroquinate dehydratase n=1 Tax=unclassified Bacillus (in: firmicutes) TaxID=185979 RepID=UPI001BECC0BF|nr:MULTISPECIES: type I 3-dehydroquinate dehydratase [unclassified Bacillus (in: firmicutes)]MBT2699806.1 type I 3-dehydroquinate dehydratase [Bacillus sp. ISL-40]MBT2721920.1 type I 3-dehydroquinate dehydratase [Bacillus sp. ISL-46]MBT2743303.1 type I 3-dehydroquinate dehydratase [Bacillus sp. ISL-77]
MTKTVTVRGLVIGEGMPKICVPLVGETLVQLKEEAEFLKTIDLDVVEWRVDFFDKVEDFEQVKKALAEIRTFLPTTPLIFTFRSHKEGGNKEITTAFYFELNKTVAETGLVDIIDVELFNDENEVKTIIEKAHAKNVFVIVSNHDFHKTPTKEEIISRLRKAQEFGGDIPKIAVMPNSTADVLTLLDATNTMNEQFADRPFITMSMAGKGVISRLAGEVFGSAVTFGAAKKASAPGQVNVKELRSVLNLLHESL